MHGGGLTWAATFTIAKGWGLAKDREVRAAGGFANEGVVDVGGGGGGGGVAVEEEKGSQEAEEEEGRAGEAPGGHPVPLLFLLFFF